MTSWAGTLQLCQRDFSIDYVSPNSRRHPHVSHRGAQHSDLLTSSSPAQALAQQLSSVFHRLEHLEHRLRRSKLPDYGHLHALVHTHSELHRRYFYPDIQNGPLKCAEPVLRAALQAVEYTYWAISQRTVYQPVNRSAWTRQSRRMRPPQIAQLHQSVERAVGSFRLFLQLRQSVQPRKLTFVGGGRTEHLSPRGGRAALRSCATVT